MIKIQIATNGKEIVDNFDEDNPTLQEVALVLLRLEEIKQCLLGLEFESKFEVKTGCFNVEE